GRSAGKSSPAGSWNTTPDNRGGNAAQEFFGAGNRAVRSWNGALRKVWNVREHLLREPNHSAGTVVHAHRRVNRIAQRFSPRFATSVRLLLGCRVVLNARRNPQGLQRLGKGGSRHLALVAIEHHADVADQRAARCSHPQWLAGELD